MATERLAEAEAIPAAYPDEPEGLSTAAAALDPDFIWARIEAHVAHRWTARDVTWIIDGTGDWKPPLTPATITQAERWTGTAWETVTLPDGPLGYCLELDGPYRIEATIGAGDPPAPVLEAFRRVAEYLADETDRAGASEYSVNMGGAIEENYRRNAAWVALALQNSGAADLLRPYRRA